MTDQSSTPTTAPQVGVIVIGRNEGARLQRALVSAAVEDVAVVYADSGSSDGSVALARGMGVQVHCLDAAQPFSAARARQEGVEQLVRAAPGLRWIQFVDGDCELDATWIAAACEHLAGHEQTGIVCGRLTEREPDRSVYNRLSALQWNAPVGRIDACGGLFMIRRSVFEQVGGFNAALLVGEEADLCSRVRAAGHEVVRITSPMAIHDSGFTRFSQWWARAVWGGYGDAIKFCTAPAEKLSVRLRQLERRLFWPIAVPVIAVCGGIALLWSAWFVLVPLSCLAAYVALFVRIAVHRMGYNDSASDAVLYAFLMIIRKFPVGFGFLMYFIQRGERSQRPDPHAAGSFVSATGREAPAAGQSE